MFNEKINDIIGKKFGKWTVLEYSHKNIRNEKMYRCQCDCGTIRIIRDFGLLYGKEKQCKSCSKSNMKNDNNLIGQRFGRLIVLDRTHNKENEEYLCHCRCVCGHELYVPSWRLKKGDSKRCCYCSHQTHGLSKTITYKIWKGLITRCYTKSSTGYQRYGGRGINVCDRWRHSFKNFLADMGERPKDMQIDRVDNNGNYEPSNCRWVTKQQNLKNRPNSRDNKGKFISPHKRNK